MSNTLLEEGRYVAHVPPDVMVALFDDLDRAIDERSNNKWRASDHYTWRHSNTERIVAHKERVLHCDNAALPLPRSVRSSEYE